MNRRIRITLPQTERLAGALLLLLALLVYVATLDNGLRIDELFGGDLITHHYAQVEGRPANAPGYPLYSMLGWLWFRLGSTLFPWLNATEILSLFSTIWALGALGVLYALLLAVTRCWTIAFLITSFYALTYFFWYYAVTSEQYASAVLQTLLFIWWAFRWQETRADRYLMYSALNIGLCLANLITELAIIPALMIFYLSQEPKLLQRGRLIARGVALALLPLVSYIYVFMAGLRRPEWRGQGEWDSVWHWFFDFLSTRQGREELALSLGPLTEEFPWLILSELTWAVLLLSLLGVLLLGKHRSVLVFSTLIFYLVLGYFTREGNWYQIIMPLYPVLLLGFGAAMACVWARLPKQVAPFGRALILVGMVMFVISRMIIIYPQANQRNRSDDDAIPLANSLVQDNPSPGALIYGTSAEIAALNYLTVVWGERPDITAIKTEEARQWFRGVDPRPLYASRAAIWLLREELNVDPPLWSAGQELIEVLRQTRTDLPVGVAPIKHPFGEGIHIAGLGCHLPSTDIVHVTVYWEATAHPKPEMSSAIVSVRPMVGGGLIYLNGDLAAHDHQPVWNAYPFGRWLPGEVVRDDYVVQSSPGIRPNGVQIVAYHLENDASGPRPFTIVELPLPVCVEGVP